MDGRYQKQFDFSEQSPVHAVVDTIANIDDSDPTAMRPLASVIEPDKLNALASPSEECTIEGSVTFTYSGYRVTVRSDGNVTVRTDHE